MDRKFIRIDNPPVLTLNVKFLNAGKNLFAETTFGITRADLAMARVGKVFAYNGHIPSWCKSFVTDLLEVGSRTSEGVMCTLHRATTYAPDEYIWMPF